MKLSSRALAKDLFSIPFPYWHQIPCVHHGIVGVNRIRPRDQLGREIGRMQFAPTRLAVNVGHGLAFEVERRSFAGALDDTLTGYLMITRIA